jgi:hypothetical protein
LNGAQERAAIFVYGLAHCVADRFAATAATGSGLSGYSTSPPPGPIGKGTRRWLRGSSRSLKLRSESGYGEGTRPLKSEPGNRKVAFSAKAETEPTAKAVQGRLAMSTENRCMDSGSTGDIAKCYSRRAGTASNSSMPIASRRLAVLAAWPGGIGDAINGVEEASDAGRIDYRGGAHPPPRSPRAPRLLRGSPRRSDQEGALGDAAIAHRGDPRARG